MSCLSYISRILLVALALMALMVMPVLAGAPPNTPPAPKALPVAPALTTVPCPPCEFCGLYPPDPNGPRVAAPQLQGAAPTASYAPTYIKSGSAPAAGYAPAHATAGGYAPAPTPAPQGTYAVGGYVSNVPTPAGPNPSLGEVWMKSGGARLQYDALRGPIQMYTNGRPLKDPAMVHLPPLYPTPKARVVRKATPKPPVAKKVASPAPSAPPVPPMTKGNASPKPVAKPLKPQAPATETKDMTKTTAPQKEMPNADKALTATPDTNKPAPKTTGENTLQIRPIPSLDNASLVRDVGPEGISRPLNSVQSPYDGPAQAVGSSNTSR